MPRNSAVDWSAFVYEGPWFGKLDVPWLGQQISTMVDAPESGISDLQKDCVRFLCGLPMSTRNKLEQRLFHAYQNGIYGSVDGGPDVHFHELTPILESSDEIWNVLSDESVQIPPDRNIDQRRQFAVTFECPWDEEHGISILFDANGDPTDIAGQGNHF